MFCGWRRFQGGKWEKVCEAESADLCERKLIDMGHIGPHELKVLPEGETPDGNGGE